MIYISLIYVMIIHSKLFGRRGFLEPVSVFFLAFLYYSYLAPIVMLNFDYFSFDLSGVTNYVSIDSIEKSSILFAIGYTGFALSYFLCTFKSKNIEYKTGNNKLKAIISDRYTVILLVFVFMVLLLLSTVFRGQLLASTQSYEGKISGNYNNSVYAFLVNIALTLLSLIYNYIILQTRRVYLITTFGVFLFFALAVATYSKAPMIYSALCVFCALHRLHRIPNTVLLFGIIIGAVVMSIFFIPMFSIYRATGELTLQQLNGQGVGLMISEASGPFTIVHLALNGYVKADGHPIWQSFALWIPRAIWPDRPLDIAEAFAQQVIANWQAGFGLGFSPFAEGYARMGFFGCFFFMALIGAMMALINRLFASFLEEKLRIPATLTIGGIISVLVLRGALSGLITQSLQNWLPVVVISLVATRLAKPRSRKHSGIINALSGGTGGDGAQ